MDAGTSSFLGPETGMIYGYGQLWTNVGGGGVAKEMIPCIAEMIVACRDSIVILSTLSFSTRKCEFLAHDDRIFIGSVYVTNHMLNHRSQYHLKMWGCVMELVVQTYPCLKECLSSGQYMIFSTKSPSIPPVYV
jgi:hypothetical protein